MSQVCCNDRHCFKYKHIYEKESAYFLIGLLCCEHAGAQNFTQEDFNPLRSLAGIWKMETRRGPVYEEWRVTDNKKLQGRSFRINDADTIVMEEIELFITNKEIIYSPAVKNQNNGQAVPFRLVNFSANRYVFENKEHDFPQRIIYHLVSADSLHARIEGTVKGKERASDFHFTRN
jgi:hypothetical protein